MAARTSTYLNLEYIRAGNTDWLSSWDSTITKLDAIGKYLRMQRSIGDSMAIRTVLSDGSIVDAIRIVPDVGGDTIAIYLGRSGKGDRVVIESSSLTTALNLANQNATATGYVCSIGATWSDEDGLLGDTIQNTTVIFNPRNNLKTTIEFPPAGPLTAPNPYLGSALQIGTDPSGVGTGTPHLKFTCQTTTGTKTYLVPAYSL